MHQSILHELQIPVTRPSIDNLIACCIKAITLNGIEQRSTIEDTPSDSTRPFIFNLRPIYLSNNRRPFGSPLNYLNDKKCQPQNRNSIESVLSLD
ncbi:hypothetical protein ANTPLA_LOCUS6992 [Anthophora plagiata]